MDDAQNIIRYTGYNTEDGGHFASLAQAVDGGVAGLSLMGTNFIGVVAQGEAQLMGLVNGTPVPAIPTPTEFLQMMASEASASEKINYMALAALKYNPVTMAAETLYRMGVAAIEGKWTELRNVSYELLTLAMPMSKGMTPALKREIQLKVKQHSFLQQQLRDGVIERSPLKDLANEKPKLGEPATQRYVVENARKDPETGAVSNGRVLTQESFGEAFRSSVEINAKGEVVYKACFAAGTLVHTEQGLLPIERVRVGTRVLSKPEHSTDLGEHLQSWRAVTNTVATLDQPMHAVQVKVRGDEHLTTLFTTPNHPFWVNDAEVQHQLHGQHWLAAEYLTPGMELQIADGRYASVHANGLVRRTQHPDVGFAGDPLSGVGLILDLRDQRIALADEAFMAQYQDPNQPLELGAAHLVRVYNFEVGETHTYFVGDAAVWVHNANCPVDQSAALDAAGTRAAAIERVAKRDPCFVAGTLVHTKEGKKPIEEIRVGDWVLSYPDVQRPKRRKLGEDEHRPSYRRVTKTFITADQLVSYVKVGTLVGNASNGIIDLIGATPNHPIYEEHPGFRPLGSNFEQNPNYQEARSGEWRPVSQLKFGSVVKNFVLGDSLVQRVDHEVGRATVYNLEVDEFHTYFVGEAGVWVHNKGNVPELTHSLKTLESKTEIYRQDWHNDLPDNSGLVTSPFTENLAKDLMEAWTGREKSLGLRHGRWPREPRPRHRRRLHRL